MPATAASRQPLLPVGSIPNDACVGMAARAACVSSSRATPRRFSAVLHAAASHATCFGCSGGQSPESVTEAVAALAARVAVAVIPRAAAVPQQLQPLPAEAQLRAGEFPKAWGTVEIS